MWVSSWQRRKTHDPADILGCASSLARPVRWSTRSTRRAWARAVSSRATGGEPHRDIVEAAVAERWTGRARRSRRCAPSPAFQNSTKSSTSWCPRSRRKSRDLVRTRDGSGSTRGPSSHACCPNSVYILVVRLHARWLAAASSTSTSLLCFPNSSSKRSSQRVCASRSVEDNNSEVRSWSFRATSSKC